MSAPAEAGVAQASTAERVEYLLRLADTSLIAGQRLGELLGHGPALEEDLALGNISLDLIGQARLLLSLAGRIEGNGRDEDALAFLRDAPQFRNMSLAEQPNGDFAETIVRQCLLDAWQLETYESLTGSREEALADIAHKAVKECRYHWRFSAGWLVRLGDGTDESHARLEAALGALWRFTDELLTPDALDARMAVCGIGPAPGLIRERWEVRVSAALAEAKLQKPPHQHYPWHGKRGVHSEHLGHLLTAMQFVPRAYPGATW
ncbi:MAG: phenylacetate-CoA oxygenase subunit PaaC [Gammaproteobacteria bacterium]|nr:phenylacetate-CoA oxygenase subunit PaaC [Gammaproteobacteria bacterium]